MKTSVIALLASMLVAQAATPVGAGGPVTLTPSSHWNLDYDTESCRLSRNFGEGEDLVALTLSKFAPDSGIEVLVGGHKLKPRGLDLKYAFLPSAEYETAYSPLYGDHQELGTVWQFGSGLLSGDEAEALRKTEAAPDVWKAREAERASEVTSLALGAGVKQPVVLRTGRLTKPFEALDQCLADLVRKWGYDAAWQASIAALPKPVGNTQSWVSPNAYPVDALRARLAGRVRIRMDVSPSGKPTGCVVQAAFSDPAFAEVACKAIMDRAEFEPARNKGGDPVASYWSETILFRPTPVRR